MQDEEENEDAIFGSENLSAAYLVPILSIDDINYNYVYALFTFKATMDGQIHVKGGDALELLDDSNSYWWAVKSITSNEIGYIPAENIETPFEKLARFNKQRNIDYSLPSQNDKPLPKTNNSQKPKLAFAEFHSEIYIDSNGEVVGKEDFLPEPEPQLADRDRKSTSLFGKLFKKKEKSVKESIPSQSTPKKKEEFYGELRSAVDSPHMENIDFENTHINILRIYVGNVNFNFTNSTFKSVSFDANTTIETLTLNTLKRFRLPDPDPTLYYMTITDLDTQSPEKRLNPDANINHVLDKYDVYSYLTFKNNQPGRKLKVPESLKIKINLIANDINPAVSSITIQIRMKGYEFRNILIYDTTKVVDVLRIAKDFFKFDSHGQYSLKSLDTNEKLDSDRLVMPLAEIADGNNKYLSLEIVNELALRPQLGLDAGMNDGPETPVQIVSSQSFSIANPDTDRVKSSLSNSIAFDDRSSLSNSARDSDDVFEGKPSLNPKIVIPARKSTGYYQSKLDPGRVSQILSEQSATLRQPSPLPQPSQSQPQNNQPPSEPTIDFDNLLSILDETIAQTAKPVDLNQTLNDLATDLEQLLTLQHEKTSAHRRQSRLSTLYNLDQQDDIDTTALFESFKTTSVTLTDMERNLNMLLIRALSNAVLPICN
ncbi:hypothetical protein BC833DRAFT_649021 [Globomyces pollinis-pini]|nr:hypothetical protein BC833DRAFT_649021 [Globomyces pollinis-pini]